jgi:hypothetical protein
MLSVRGIYDGKQIKPLEEFDVPPNVEVIITFMDQKTTSKSRVDKRNGLPGLSGTWEDDRPVEEIIKEIYDSRTSKREDIVL